MVSLEGAGLEHKLRTMATTLFPIRRSIVGEAVRESLEVLDPSGNSLKLFEYPSGARVGNWTIPLGWRVDGHVSIGSEEFAADSECFLIPWGEASLRGFINRGDVDKIAVFGPRADVFQYRTNYYGSCKPKVSLPGRVEEQALVDGISINIESERYSDFVHIGQFYRAGRSKAEIVFSTYTCHPCLANDNLSGMIVAKFLTDYIERLADPYYSYRILYFPETIGAQLAIRDLIDTENTLHAFILTCLGGDQSEGIFKVSKWPSLIERIALEATQHRYSLDTIKFTPDGSDERQYAGCKKRISARTISYSQFYRYKEYHCSDVVLDFLNISTVDLSIKMYEDIVEAIEGERIPQSKMVYGEPCISALDLPGFHSGGSYRPSLNKSKSCLEIIDLCDGRLTEGEIVAKIDAYADSVQTYNLMLDRGVISYV